MERFGEKSKTKSENIEELIDLIVDEDISLDYYDEDDDCFNTQYCVWDSPMMGMKTAGLVYRHPNV